MPPGVYNVTVGRVELTQARSEQDFAQSAFQQLQEAGLLPQDATFAQYGPVIRAEISNQDGDRYLDLDVLQLADRLRARGLRITDEQVESTLSQSDIIDSYFDDRVELSRAAVQPATPLADPNHLAQMSLADAREYFFMTYGQTGTTWDDATISRFQTDYQAFMSSHFVSMPMDGAVAAAGGVNEYFNSRITDVTLQQFSRDSAGHYRIDCGVYTAISAQIFLDCGLTPRYGVARIYNPEDRSTAGHAISFVVLGGRTLIASNGELEVNREDVQGEERLARVIREALERRLVGGRCLSVGFSDSMLGAIEAARTASSPVVLAYYTFLGDLESRFRGEGHPQAPGLGDHLVFFLCGEFDNDERFVVLERTDRALSQLDSMIRLLPESPNVTIGEITDQAELRQFFELARTVIRAYRLAIRDVIGLDPLDYVIRDGRPEPPNYRTLARSPEHQYFAFDEEGFVRAPSLLSHELAAARTFFQAHPRAGRPYLQLLEHILRLADY